jgi:hypothetical protein
MQIPHANDRIPLPNLDDLTFDDLVHDALAEIPALNQKPRSEDAESQAGLNHQWTDYNPADPGITLIEMFAWLTELLIYRVNAVPPKSLLTFLSLLNVDPPPPDCKPAIDDTTPITGDPAPLIHKTLAELRKPFRVVTQDDFETLTVTEWAKSIPDAAHNRVRAHCLPRRNMEGDGAAPYDKDAPGHVTLIALVGVPDGAAPDLPSTLRGSLVKFLDERRLLTTIVHVIGPTYVQFSVDMVIVLRPDARPADVNKQIGALLTNFFSPLRADGQDWRFGRSVYVSELYKELREQVSGIDYIKQVDLKPEDASRLLFRDDRSLVGLAVRPHELVHLTGVHIEQVKS